MDYKSLPRELIYKERADLKDFGVQTSGTLNHQLFSILKKYFVGEPRSKELMLRCFNNAYYICTIIQFEDFPEMEVAAYGEMLLKGEDYYPDGICLFSMALVCHLLPACNTRWRQDGKELIETIIDYFTHYRWLNMGVSKDFGEIANNGSCAGLTLPTNEFAPRDIIEVIENEPSNILVNGVEYICERLPLLPESRQRIYGADMTIARLRDDQRELCEESNYNPKTDRFNYIRQDIEDIKFEDSIRKAFTLRKEAIEYIENHYPQEYVGEQDISTEESLSQHAENPNMTAQQTTAPLLKRIEDLEKAKAELEEVKAENKHLMTINEVLQKQNDRYESMAAPSVDLNEDQKLQIDERIIFFSSLLGCSLRSEDIVQTKFAELIRKLTGDDKESIRTRICTMNTEIQKVDDGKREKFSEGTSEAAKNVYELLDKAVKGLTRAAKPYQCKQAMENINNTYHLGFKM